MWLGIVYMHSICWGVVVLILVEHIEFRDGVSRIIERGGRFEV